MSYILWHYIYEFIAKFYEMHKSLSTRGTQFFPVERLVVLLHIREVTGCNIGPETGFLVLSFFSGLPQPLQADPEVSLKCSHIFSNS
jgi:hypothetical protein